MPAVICTTRAGRTSASICSSSLGLPRSPRRPATRQRENGGPGRWPQTSCSRVGVRSKAAPGTHHQYRRIGFRRADVQRFDAAITVAAGGRQHKGRGAVHERHELPGQPGKLGCDLPVQVTRRLRCSQVATQRCRRPTCPKKTTQGRQSLANASQNAPDTASPEPRANVRRAMPLSGDCHCSAGVCPV